MRAVLRVSGWSGREGERYGDEPNPPPRWLKLVIQVDVLESDPAFAQAVINAYANRTPLTVTVHSEAGKPPSD